MKSISKLTSLAAFACCGAALNAQPLAKPLADFDRMISELKTSSAVGAPISVGTTTVVPFAAVQFGLGAAGPAGGMGVKTVPLGVVIVEGDDVRVESLPHSDEKTPSAMQQIVQGIIDKKILFMVNGINLGNASGSVSDLAPMVSAMMGQTNVMVNGLNLGNLNAPKPQAAAADKTIAELEAAVNKNPTAEGCYKLGEALRKAGQNVKAAAAYQKAIGLKPGYPEAARALAELKKSTESR